MINHFTIKTRLFLTIGLMAAVMLILTGINLYALHQTNRSLKTVYDDTTIPLVSLAEINVRLLHIRTAIVTSIAYPDEAATQLEKVEQDLLNINTLWNKYLESNITPEEKSIADKFSADALRFAANVKTVVELKRSSKAEEASKFYFEEVRSSYTPAAKGIDDIIQFQKNLAQQVYEAAEDRYAQTRLISVTVLTLIFSLAIFIGCMVVRGVTRSLQTAQKIAGAIAAGDLSSNIDDSGTDEIGVLLSSMKTMQDSINTFVAGLNAMAQRHAQGFVKQPLDAEGFPGTYGKMAHEVNELIQSPIAINKRVIEIVSQYAKGDFSHDMETLPGERIAITDAMHNIKQAFLDINSEIKTLAEAGARGDFSMRGNEGKFEFLFKEIIVELNTLIETCDVGFNDILRVANGLAQGDLSHTITTDYPGLFGKAKEGINGTVENLQCLIGEIKIASDTIGTAAKEIAAGNNDLSHRTEEQAASLQQTAASMEELATAVQQNSHNAEHANQLAVAASETAGQGVKVIGDVVATMENITEASNKIVDIITVIDNIAFQTNILALNAAVEASRAGDQGKGFAVVATEVRNLAQRATAAAAEISLLIGDSTHKVKNGSKLVVQAGKTMQDIVSSINGVTNIMSKISAASVEQSSGIDQINQAITQMDEATQQNAALVEQAAAASESLEEQTQHLTSAVANFRLHADASGYGHFFNKTTAQKITTIDTVHASENRPVKLPEALITADADGWEEF